MSRGGTFACVASLPTPSPCNRRYRLELLWAGLTPGESRLRLLVVDRSRPQAALRPSPGNSPGLPSSRCRPWKSGHLFASLHACHGLKSTPMELRRPRLCGRRNAGFPLLLPGLLPCLDIYGAISTFRRVRAALWPTCFPLYASSKLFRHPSALAASGCSLVLRWLPHLFMA